MRFAKTFLAAAAISLALGHPAAAGTIFVKFNASGANDGTSWANAYTDLQAALAAAVASDEIWVAAGTYKPTATTDRTISFALKNGVGIYGGFAGTETMRSQRNPAANVTTLSGDIGTVGVATDNSYHVVTSDGTVTATGILDGFTVTGGRADGPTGGDPTGRGAGAFVNGGSAAFVRCIFTNGYASDRGGGVRVAAGSPSFTDCTFQGNSAGQAGGGLAAASVGSMQITGCVFRGNTVASPCQLCAGGGGIEATNSTSVVNSVIAQNSPNGASFFQGSNSFVNTTVASNGAYGIVFLDVGNSVVNSIVYGNPVGGISYGISGNAAVSYSDVQEPTVGTGNIAANPLFLNAPSDLRLGAGSPAVDVGNNAGVPGGVTTDVSGLPRFFDDPAAPNVGAGTPPIVDMGAHERVPLTVSAPSPSTQTVCAGASASFSVTASGSPPISYRWRKGGIDLSDDGAVSGATTAMLTINPTVTGDSGSYGVVVMDDFGQSLMSPTATLTVNAIPSAPVANNNGPICVGQTLQLSASTVSGATYSWTGPNGFSSSQQNPSIPSATVAASGTYSVTATVAGCTSSPATTNATVNTSPSAVITAPASVCPYSAGNTASVPDAGVGATYSWSITNGVITGGAGTREITFTASGGSGSVHLEVTVQSGGGCSSMSSKDVAIECGTSFFTVTPCRVADTRGPDGPYGGPALSAGVERVFVITDQCGIPPTARAVSFNVTVTQAAAQGHVLLYPAGVSPPLVSAINFRAGQTRANNAIVPLGTGGTLAVLSAAPTHLILDVNGYFQ